MLLPAAAEAAKAAMAALSASAIEKSEIFLIADARTGLSHSLPKL